MMSPPLVLYSIIGICRLKLQVLINFKDMGTDKICDTSYTMKKHRREALLLHLDRLIMGT